MKNWIVIGATSAIAEAVCRIWAIRGYKLFLVARKEDKLRDVARDLSVRGAAQVETFTLDVNRFDHHPVCFDEAITKMGNVDGLFIAHGTLPDQQACQASFEAAHREINTNALCVISFCTLAANLFEQQRQGDIAVIGSVAGDRGRRSNYVYGAAKGMVSIFLQGLRNRLAPASVHVLTIKPGFVDTPLTASFDKSGPLWASAEQVAAGIVKSVDKRRNTVYLPWFWWVIMNVIRYIPESIFKKMKM